MVDEINFFSKIFFHAIKYVDNYTIKFYLCIRFSNKLVENINNLTFITYS